MNERLTHIAIRFSLLAALAAGLASPAWADGLHVRLDPVSALIQPGDTLVVNVTVTPADAQFNAFDLIFSYDPARLTFLAVSPISKQVGSLVTASCTNLFHLFTPNAASGSLTANLSLLCNNVYLTGPGVVYTVKFRAGSLQGSSVVTLATGTQFYRAGLFVKPLEVTPLTVSIGAVGVPAPGPGEVAGAIALRAPAPNPRRGAGDLVVAVRLTRPALVELTLWDATGRRVAHRAPETLPAGEQGLRWRLPRLAAGRYILRASTPGGAVAEAPWTVVR